MCNCLIISCACKNVSPRFDPIIGESLGLRYETQNNIHDWRDFSPRLTVAWAPGSGKNNSSPKTVIRAGCRTFYDRFSLSNRLAALRYNGIVQQQFVISNPDFFPTIPSITSLAGSQTTQTIQQISPTLRVPYVIQSAVSLERQLPFKTTIAITYANAHGLHMLRSEVRPGPVFLMESSGLYNQNQITYVIGNITSPLFGHANQLPGGGGGFGGGGGLGFSESANNRRLELQMRFSF